MQHKNASNFNATSHINVSGPQKNFADILEMMSWIGDTVQNKLSNNFWINDLCRIRGGMKIDSRTSGSVWCVHCCRLEDLSLQGSSNPYKPQLEQKHVHKNWSKMQRTSTPKLVTHSDITRSLYTDSALTKAYKQDGGHVE
ncbi:uncharacterized protein [Dysidea avara]|uniref:uncharacterized protein isoform X1 n=1 Tax=Dysidea avara TaxID=196820 RepID=UPI00332BB2E3